jgi:hypothetical protein
MRFAREVPKTLRSSNGLVVHTKNAKNTKVLRLITWAVPFGLFQLAVASEARSSVRAAREILLA